MKNIVRWLGLGLVVALVAAGCGSATEKEPQAGLTGELVVFAAASLQGTFEELGEELKADNPDLTVTFNFGSSATLAEQISSGAPADVIATANRKTIESIADDTDEPTLFATNTLVIVTPPDNPANVKDLNDFTVADNKIALCAVEVPCGSAADSVFKAANITPDVDTFGENVTATLNLVIAGEIDAAMVYVTDSLSAGDKVNTIEFPEAKDFPNENLIATLTAAPNTEAAQAWLDLVLSDKGRAVFEKAGFVVVK